MVEHKKQIKLKKDRIKELRRSVRDAEKEMKRLKEEVADLEVKQQAQSEIDFWEAAFGLNGKHIPCITC